MTEILDPRTKSCTFLTLKDYVGEVGKFKRAQCLMEKNEAFMSSENLWIAAESFKISVSPNPQGLVYRMIPPEYFMDAEFSSPSATENFQLTQLTQDFRIDLSGAPITYSEYVLSYRFNYNQAIGAQAAGVAPLPPLEMDMDIILKYWLKELNRFFFCKMALVSVGINDPTNNNQLAGTLGAQLMEDPLDKLQGRAFGVQGLERIEATFISDHPAPVGGDVANVHSQYWKIDGKKHPGLTADALKNFICGDRYGSFAYRLQRNAIHGNPDHNPGRLPEFQVYGPAIISSGSVAFTSDPGGGYNAEIPGIVIFNSDGELKEGGTALGWHQNVAGVERLYHTIITGLDSNWIFKDHNGDLYMSLWSHLINPNQLGGWTNPPEKDTVYQFYSGGDLTGVPVESLFTLDIKVKLGKFQNTGAPPLYVPLPAGVKQVCSTAGTGRVNVPSKTIDSYTRRVATWATDDDEVPCYTPNDFFSYFNTFPGDIKPPYRLGQDPNGGFRVSIIGENLSGFSMSKLMMDDLGLNNFLTVPNQTKASHIIDRHQPEVIPLDIDNNWKANYSGSGKFSTRLTLGSITSFSIINQAGTIIGPLEFDTQLGALLISHVDGNRYQLIQMHELKIQDSEIADTKFPGQLMADEDNNLYYYWPNPQQASFLSNTQTVSLDSYALFSSIRIVVPDGVIFQPMLAGRSDARILAELRLVFDLSPSQVLQGFGPDAGPYGLLMSTSFTNYGDLLWNSGASKQYLQVTSGNPIYRINCEVRLIYRDPTREPKVLYLGYNDLFELKLRLIQLQ